MQIRAIFSEKQPSYRYMPINDTMADVFIYKFIETIENEEDGSIQYIHEMNEFRIEKSRVTEEMVKKEPLKYLDYIPDNENINLEDRINALEDALMELAGVVYNG